MDIALYSVPLTGSAECVAELRRVLSEDERARADRFRFPHLTRRFVIARGALRLLLGARLHRAPEEIELAEERNGKPCLPGGGLHFNVSHSEDLAVYAMTEVAPVGIDVERTRNLNAEGLARRFFAPAEAAELASVSHEERMQAFFQCWTRKEAYLKAVGDGLLAPLDAFEVTLRPGEAAAFRHISGDAEEARRWTLASFEPRPGFVGAIAIRARPVSLAPWHHVRDACDLLASARS